MHRLSEGLQAFFFEAALATYAGGASKTTIEGLPGSKVYRYERGEYLYIDTYFTNGEQSGGQTIIYINNVPAWLMQYHGWCKNDDKVVLDFLKHVLAKAYESRVFYGGRGSPYERLLKNDLIYGNVWSGSFNHFHGEEAIYKLTEERRERLFWHKFSGVTLLQ